MAKPRSKAAAPARALASGRGRLQRLLRYLQRDLRRRLRGHVRARRRPGGPRNGPERGADLRYDVEITLEQAFRGMEREIVVPRAQACEPCSGTGSEGNAPLETCTTCQGAGQVRAQPRHVPDRAHLPCLPRPRPSDQNAVPLLRRARPSQKERTLSVKIPAGVEDGTRIRLAGEGDAGAARRPTGRSLSLPLGEAARSVRARRPRSLLPRARADVQSGTWRRDGNPHHRRRTRQDHHPRRRANRPPLPHQGQGHDAPARQGSRRSACRVAGGNAGEPDREANASCSKNSPRIAARKPPADTRLLRQREALLRTPTANRRRADRLASVSGAAHKHGHDAFHCHRRRRRPHGPRACSRRSTRSALSCLRRHRA